MLNTIYNLPLRLALQLAILIILIPAWEKDGLIGGGISIKQGFYVTRLKRSTAILMEKFKR